MTEPFYEESLSLIHICEKFLGILDRVRAAIPHAAITTDIIVGFPGETEDDFAATLDVVRASRFSAAFTFQYSCLLYTSPSPRDS